MIAEITVSHCIKFMQKYLTCNRPSIQNYLGATKQCNQLRYNFLGVLLVVWRSNGSDENRT